MLLCALGNLSTQSFLSGCLASPALIIFFPWTREHLTHMSIFSLCFGHVDILKHLFTFQTLLILQKECHNRPNQAGGMDTTGPTLKQLLPLSLMMTTQSRYPNSFQPPHTNTCLHLLKSFKNFLVMFYIISICLCSGVPVCFEYPVVLCLGSTVLAVRLLLPQETVDFPGASLVLNPG